MHKHDFTHDFTDFDSVLLSLFSQPRALSRFIELHPEQWDPLVLKCDLAERFVEESYSVLAADVGLSLAGVAGEARLAQYFRMFRVATDADVTALALIERLVAELRGRLARIASIMAPLVGLPSLQPFMGVYSHDKVHSFALRNGNGSLDALRVTVASLRAVRNTYEAELVSTMELAGEDMATLDKAHTSIAKAELTFGRGRMAVEMLVHGTHFRPMPSPEDDAAKSIGAFYKQWKPRGKALESSDIGEMQLWHQFQLRPVHVLPLPWELAYNAPQAGRKGATFGSAKVGSWMDGLTPGCNVSYTEHVAWLGAPNGPLILPETYPRELGLQAVSLFCCDASLQCDCASPHTCRAVSLLPPTTKTYPEDVMERGAESAESADDQQQHDLYMGDSSSDSDEIMYLGNGYYRKGIVMYHAGYDYHGGYDSDSSGDGIMIPPYMFPGRMNHY